jgi:hypothetical protein
MIRAEVPVDGEESSTNQDEQDAAAEPRHRRRNVAHSFRAALGREPIVAMRKIDAVIGFCGDLPGSDETDEG